jgi:hypothetical protein
LILNCPEEPLVLFEGDPLPSNPQIEYVVVRDQNEAEIWNERVRRAGAVCRQMVKENCQFYKDNKTKPVCEGIRE